MLSPRQRRFATRIWITLSIIFFFATCADRLRPYLKGIAGARDAGATQYSAPRQSTASQLRLASWNMHFLDVEGQGHDHRARSDYEALRRYAEALNADVIAVQEVANESALQLVFTPERYAYHLAEPGGAQRSGFVFRRSLDVRVQADLTDLALDTLRAASDIEVRFAGRKLRLLSIHLKAFCVTGSLQRDDKDCHKLRAQLPVLEQWIDARAREQTPFAVLGDFNRVLTKPNDELFEELNDGEPKGLRLQLASTRTHSECRPSKRAHAIDHMLLGGPAASWQGPEGQLELPFSSEDVAARRKLSDHCPITLMLAPPAMH